MKYARKMVLVDETDYNRLQHLDDSPKNNILIKTTPTPESKLIYTLEHELNKILVCKDLDDYDKCKHYIEILRKYLFFIEKDKNTENAVNILETNNTVKNLHQPIINKTPHLSSKSSKPIKQLKPKKIIKHYSKVVNRRLSFSPENNSEEIIKSWYSPLQNIKEEN
jgi:hypothetical protein